MRPAATETLVGDTVMDCKVAAVVVNWAVPLMEFSVAVIVTGPPALTPVASPCEPVELLMVARLGFVEDHVTDVVMSWALLSE